uniref:Uncharacterized protein n=1 Tax=Lotharella oceanica TaxID=641309 RepID=A0A7S2TRC9_9EUKA|mmetsp:Transcript_23733/g.44332  ORF Transcript_23733/g.44332 Transcript_23733/m.44332 type:complete len:125 (+) Transcript_23733:645-1019(+)
MWSLHVQTRTKTQQQHRVRVDGVLIDESSTTTPDGIHASLCSAPGVHSQKDAACRRILAVDEGRALRITNQAPAHGNEDEDVDEQGDDDKVVGSELLLHVHADRLSKPPRWSASCAEKEPAESR